MGSSAGISARPEGRADGALRRVGRRAVRSGTPLGLGGAAAALLATAATHPWWSFVLYAPQYPDGLRLEVWLQRVTGDVREIDTLNHYIGMASLSQAAPLERAVADHAVLAFIAAMFLGLLVRSRWASIALTLPIIAFPLAFLLDSFGWLYHFGHNLDPRAPLDMQPFTPQLFGNGVIGQFMTFAVPEQGFWLAVAAAIVALTALVLHQGIPVSARGRSGG